MYREELPTTTPPINHPYTFLLQFTIEKRYNLRWIKYLTMEWQADAHTYGVMCVSYESRGFWKWQCKGMVNDAQKCSEMPNVHTCRVSGHMTRRSSGRRFLTKKTSSIPELSCEGSIASSGTEKASMLNTFFGKCFNHSQPPLNFSILDKLHPMVECP